MKADHKASLEDQLLKPPRIEMHWLRSRVWKPETLAAHPHPRRPQHGRSEVREDICDKPSLVLHLLDEQGHAQPETVVAGARPSVLDA